MNSKKDVKLFFATLGWFLAPSIYFLVRAQFISISGANINILGQLEWFDLIDEILITCLTIPMYSLLKNSTPRQNFKVLTILFSIYLVFAIFVSIYMNTLTEFMHAENATRYLLLQTISLLISFISTIMITLFILNSKYLVLIILIVIKLVGLGICDAIFIPKFQEYGASYSEILIHTIIAIAAIIIGFKLNILDIKKNQTNDINKITVKSWVKVGFWGGVQIFLDNFIYFLIIMRMVNAVEESGNYWMANNFIYGWLLVPVTALCEIIKKNNYEKLTFKNTWIFCLGIVGLWLITLPFWKPFINHALAMDAALILPIILPLTVFYLAYIVCVVIDSFFISKGKTYFLAIISAVVNIIYYGIMYILFLNDVFTLGLSFIICLFGFGIVVHMICAIILYIIFQHKAKNTVLL